MAGRLRRERESRNQSGRKHSGISMPGGESRAEVGESQGKTITVTEGRCQCGSAGLRNDRPCASAAPIIISLQWGRWEEMSGRLRSWSLFNIPTPEMFMCVN